MKEFPPSPFLFYIVVALLSLSPPSLHSKEAPLRIHLVSGSDEYDSEHSLKTFKTELEATHDVSITASWGHDKIEELPNLAPLAKADLLVVFARRMDLPPAQMKLFREHWGAGKPVIGIRTASHAFQADDNAIFDLDVLGGHYNGHYRDEPVKVTNEPQQSQHPVIKGVAPFGSQKLYKVGPLNQNTLVLQTGDNGKGVEPVTLVNTYKGGRMFYTSLGTQEDFKNPAFQTLLKNAIFWTTNRDAAALKK